MEWRGGNFNVWSGEVKTLMFGVERWKLLFKREKEEALMFGKERWKLYYR